MVKSSLIIGENHYKSKKSALQFYREILNKYEPKQSLNDADYEHLWDLLNYTPPGEKMEEEFESTSDEEIEIDDIYVDLHPVFKSTKCFFVKFGVETWILSFILTINGSQSPEKKFYLACRNAVRNELRQFKERIFRDKPVKCAISKSILNWEDCHIDHKPPLTFSVIVKTFIESKNIKIGDIKIETINHRWEFKDKRIQNEFISYHQRLAVLRVVSKIENLKSSSKGRIKMNKNDYKIQQNDKDMTIDLFSSL